MAKDTQKSTLALVGTTLEWAMPSCAVPDQLDGKSAKSFEKPSETEDRAVQAPTI